jgi:DnaK suppressor protein
VTPERARELLSAERDRIERALADLRKPSGAGEASTVDDTAEQASDLYERELEGGLREGLLRELEALERAEARLVEGTYGLSVESGEPIPDERLEAFPLAERTVEEERRVERGA